MVDARLVLQASPIGPSREIGLNVRSAEIPDIRPRCLAGSIAVQSPVRIPRTSGHAGHAASSNSPCPTETSEKSITSNP